jgi:N-acyl homoserine lactone hydrolase
MSLLLRLPQTGTVLLTADAVLNEESFRPDRQISPLDLDAERTIASTIKLLEIVKREQVALTIFGHDGHQWPTLKMLPDYYEESQPQEESRALNQQHIHSRGWLIVDSHASQL